MQQFRADLHVHTVLSPCGDLDMSPVNIVELAIQRKIDILGITDHNSTKHCALIKKLAEEKGIFVLCGAEVTTKEEIHCLTFFENLDTLTVFEEYLDQHITKVKNKPNLFGYQVVVDEDDKILEEVDHLLINAIDQSIDQVEEKVHGLGGLFIPAHIDRPAYSLFSQLGFVPPDLKADALEVSKMHTISGFVESHPELKGYTFIQSSDAHLPEQLGTQTTTFEIATRSFKEIKMALKGENGRRVYNC